MNSTTNKHATRIALFAGSFDPFTRGHKDIVDRALATVADKVVIAIGINCQKKCMLTPEERAKAITAVYQDEPRVSIHTYTGLTTDYAQQIGADFLLRGVRSIKDFEYERDIAEMNSRISGIETVLLFTEHQYACISSSAVRELIAFGKDVSNYLP